MSFGPGVGGGSSVRSLRPKLCDEFSRETRGSTILSDDLSREVYGVLGIPIDAADLNAVVRRLGAAITHDAPFLMSTPNLNFLVTSQTNLEFRESLLRSDLCPVDGVPIVWISRLLGVPIRMRVAGSDIFDSLKAEKNGLAKVFLFGGPEGVAETACNVLNAQSNGVVCVGALFPGYGSVEDMSGKAIIDTINASGAGFLVVSLGAQKGQSWLLHNHHRLRIAVRSHLGAAINFQAGLLKRAPLFVRRFGLEWLWRIKQEPYLWRRYLQDGLILLGLMLTSVLPLVLGRIWRRARDAGNTGLVISKNSLGRSVKITLVGGATADQVERTISVFREAIAQGDRLTIDISGLRHVDARFLGLLLMVRKQKLERGEVLEISGATARMKRGFHLNRFGFLLDPSDVLALPERLRPILRRPEVAVD
jgi:N-acetylglucosaminyldiphosphoundecaprenol N-acetyl-beta-D-mannosaminyltransferase